MDGSRFDDITRALATGTSRRRVLGALAAGLAVALGGRPATRAQGNNDCTPFCTEVFRPGPARGKCLSDAAHGEGLCAQCSADPAAVCVGAGGTVTCCPAGCCDGAACQPGTTDDACGTGGGACAACTGTGVTCGGGGVAGRCGCTRDCDGKCGGVADGCGGFCDDDCCSDCADAQDACLVNGSCAETCKGLVTTPNECPADCHCGFGPIEGSTSFGPFHCIVNNPDTGASMCDRYIQTCTSTTQCPKGQECQIVIGCGPGGAIGYWCVQLCPTA